MIKEIEIPEIAENVTDGIVIGVLVSEGDTIEADQDILEIETDKAAVELPAPFGGTVTEILVSEGDEVAVGQAVMKVETDGEAEEEAGEEEAGEKKTRDEGAESAEEDARDEDRERKEPKKRDAERKRDEAEERTAGKRREKKEPEPAGEKRTKEDREPEPAGDATDVPASPATRRLARELGIDITRVKGSGPSGRITADDVKSHARKRTGGGEAAREGGAERREKLTRIRALTAERTTTSWQTIPHVTQHDEADLTRLNDYMSAASARVEKAGGKLTVTAVLTKLVAHALRVYPRFNASADMDAGEIVYHARVAIGIAVDTDRGLLVPVLQDPDRKGILEIAVEIGELAAAARGGDLEVSQMQGATFSISNLGGISGTGFSPIVVPPQVAILGVARSQMRPFYTGSTFEPREMLPFSLSYDHRVIDGADGARFTRWLKTAIEDPFAALMEGGG